MDYKVNEAKRDLFHGVAVRYFPFLEPEDLTLESSGIRQVLAKGLDLGVPNDFVIVHEAERGLPGLINLIGIESPGLTASLAIGKYVRDLLLSDLIMYI